MCIGLIIPNISVAQTIDTLISKDTIAEQSLHKNISTIYEEDSLTQRNNVFFKKKAIKVNVLASIGNNISVAYEHWVCDQWSIENRIGFIGGSWRNNGETKTYGLFVKIGAKYLTQKSFYAAGKRWDHPLNSFYVKPEMVLGYYKRQEKVTIFPENGASFEEMAEETDLTLALLVNIGKQWVLYEWLAVDAHLGLGYGYSSGAKNTQYGTITPYKYSHISGDNSIPIAISSGLSVGILF